MESSNDRRSFLGKFFLGASAMLTTPFAVAAVNDESQGLIKEDQTDKPVIKKLQAMGFQWETRDPFLFCVHHEDKFPKGNESMGPVTSMQGRQLGDDFIIKDGFRMYHGKKVPGFPGHPHRGFETITVVREGFVDHADSLGAAGRYGNGDVQWMTAGKGVQHSEMFPLLSKDKNNPMELFQIWLNLPKKSKMIDAHFTMHWREKIPHYEHKDTGGKSTHVEVIAGVLNGKKAQTPPPGSWAANPTNEVAIWNIKLEPGAKWTLPAAKNQVNRNLYYYIGDDLLIAGKKIPRYHSMEVEAGVSLEIVNGKGESRILMLQGKPINEPVIQYGPFVMNSKEEIQQAFEDYNKTKFGGWPWPKYDQVHERSSGRFALHADGRKEVRNS